MHLCQGLLWKYCENQKTGQNRIVTVNSYSEFRNTTYRNHAECFIAFSVHVNSWSSLTCTSASAAQQEAFHSFTAIDKWVELLGLKTERNRRNFVWLSNQSVASFRTNNSVIFQICQSKQLALEAPRRKGKLHPYSAIWGFFSEYYFSEYYCSSNTVTILTVQEWIVNAPEGRWYWIWKKSELLKRSNISEVLFQHGLLRNLGSVYALKEITVSK